MTLTSMIGKKCIVRTKSDGVWYGTIIEKSGDEVIISNARRLYYWYALKGVSLSAVALYGINKEKSKIIEACESHWTVAIGITPCTEASILTLDSAPNVEAT